MSPNDRHTRRSAIRLVGATSIGSLLAGCGGPGDAEDEPENAAWEDVDAIELEADVNGWIGRSPDGIADEENPALELYAGREYDLTWENGDGEYHNFSLHSKDEAVEEQLDEDERLEGTELLEGEGESLDLTFEATEEMEGYVCEMHPESMAAGITIQEEDASDTEADDENGG